jgi:hypothetical protein
MAEVGMEKDDMGRQRTGGKSRVKEMFRIRGVRVHKRGTQAWT